MAILCTRIINGTTYTYSQNKEGEAPLVFCNPRLPDCYWECYDCGNDDINLRYNGITMQCHDCVRWLNLSKNSAYEWRLNKGLKPQFTKQEFLKWSRLQLKACAYCGIPQNQWEKVAGLNDAGTKSQVLGLDRKDSKIGYTLDNIVICCLDCNRAKAGQHSAEAFKKYVAPGIKALHLSRLGFSNEIIDKHMQDSFKAA